MDTLAALALGTEKPTTQLLDRKPFGRYDSLISYLMLRNILVQAIYQCVCCLPLMFAGKYIPFLHAPCAFVKTISSTPSENFYEHCASNIRDTSEALEDRTYDRFGQPYYSLEDVQQDTEVIQTIIFNIFVFCQVFNMINSRRVNGEHNVFAGLFTNFMFLGIMAFICIMQVVIVQFLGILFGGVEFNPGKGTYGLSWQGWIISLILSALTLLVGQICFFIPVPKTKPKKFKGEDSIITKILECKCFKKEEKYEEFENKHNDKENSPLVEKVKMKKKVKKIKKVEAMTKIKLN